MGERRTAALVTSVLGCLGLVAAAVPASAAATPDPPGTVRVTTVPVTAFSLSPYRLVDVDARSIGGANVPGAYNTTVTTTNVHTGVGSTGTVHRPAAPGDVKGSGTTTAYLLGTGAEDVTRVVRTPHGSLRVRHTLGDRWFPDLSQSSSLSGNRYVYAVEQPTNHYRAYLLDASTGRRTLVQRALGYGVPAVFGNYVASQHPDGSVWRRDLVTGARVQVSPPQPLPVTAARLFVWGDYVGWDLLTGDDDEGAGPRGSSFGYRNVRTMAPPRTFPGEIEQLSSAGAVVETLAPGASEVGYSLATYDGGSVPLLPAGHGGSAPQVEGRAMAWADQAGLKIAQLDLPLAPPRYLGAPYIPTHRVDNPTHGHFWHAALPYSAPLSSCSVQVAFGSRVVQNRGCGFVHVRVGVADVPWDAMAQDGGPVRAGTYHLRVTARSLGDQTAALDADGERRPVVLTVLVGHATRTVLHAAPSRVRRGASSVVSAHLTTTLGSRHAHRDVSFYRRLADGTWHRIGTRRTSAAGTARIRVRPGRTAVYRASFAGSRIDRPSTSTARSVRVHR